MQLNEGLFIWLVLCNNTDHDLATGRLVQGLINECLLCYFFECLEQPMMYLVYSHDLYINIWKRMRMDKALQAENMVIRTKSP